MKRLTYWCSDGKGGGEWRANVCGTEVKGEEVDRLAYYENLEEQRRLVVLPCRIDATVYDIRRFYKGRKVVRQEITSGEIDHFTIGEAGNVITTVCLHGNEWADYEPDDLILTREEAEAALKGD